MAIAPSTDVWRTNPAITLTRPALEVEPLTRSTFNEIRFVAKAGCTDRGTASPHVFDALWLAQAHNHANAAARAPTCALCRSNVTQIQYYLRSPIQSDPNNVTYQLVEFRIPPKSIIRRILLVAAIPLNMICWGTHLVLLPVAVLVQNIFFLSSALFFLVALQPLRLLTKNIVSAGRYLTLPLTVPAWLFAKYVLKKQCSLKKLMGVGGAVTTVLVVSPAIALFLGVIIIVGVCEALKKPPKRTGDIVSELRQSKGGVISTFADNRPGALGNPTKVLQALRRAGTDIGDLLPLPAPVPAALAPVEDNADAMLEAMANEPVPRTRIRDYIQAFLVEDDRQDQQRAAQQIQRLFGLMRADDGPF